MPIYDFRCEKCAYEFEKRIGMFDFDPPCPECENGTVKIFKFVPNIHYKGSGFASTADNLKRDKSGRIEDVVPGAS